MTPAEYRAAQCRAPVLFNVRRPDRSGDYYFVCQAHVAWGQAQFPDSRITVRAIRAGEVTSGCVAPKAAA